METDFTVLGDIAFKEQVGCRFNIISADMADI
jgi:hypothetical protein